MSAGGELQAVMAAALSTEQRLAGIFDGPPARANFPYAIIDASSESDWSHKSGRGREVLVAVTLWDEEPVRLAELADRIEQLVENVRQVPDWQLASLQQLRRKTLRDVAGPWAAALDFRARLLSA